MVRTLPGPLIREREVLLCARGLTKSFARGLARAAARTVALDDVDLDLRSGEILAVVGPEGSGKTTLLQCLGGLLKRDSGRVELSGLDVARYGLTRQIAYVPAVPVYYPFLTVRDVLVLHAARANGAGQMSGLVDAILEAGGLHCRRAHLISGLSQHELRQLALAEAVMSGPAVVLVDSSGHACDTSAAVNGALAACRSAGIPILIAARDGSGLSAVASRMMFLHEGRLERIFTAEPRPFIERDGASPAALFVAERVH